MRRHVSASTRRLLADRGYQGLSFAIPIDVSSCKRIDRATGQPARADGGDGEGRSNPARCQSFGLSRPGRRAGVSRVAGQPGAGPD